MKLISPDRNLYETSEKELLKLKYSKVDLTNKKGYFLIGDYLLIESHPIMSKLNPDQPHETWALIGPSILNKTSFFKEIEALTLYRKL